MSQTPAVPSAPAFAPGLALTGCRWLTPEAAKVFVGTFSLLHCAVKDDTLYRGVFAVLLFPISHPDGYVSLRYSDLEGKDKEIGVIRDLSTFPPEQQQLIRASLNRQYHEQVITRVYEVQCEFGLLFFDAETQRGREQFTMPWRGDRAEDFGAKGKVLLESLGNRYVIPDVTALPPADRRRFTSFIYW